MRGRHAAKPAGARKRPPRRETIGSACRRSLAHRDAKPCDRFRREFPARRIPGTAPAAPTQDRTVRRRRGSRVPKLGENRGEFALRVVEWREDGCLQRRAVASAVFGIRLPEGRPGTAPAASAWPPRRYGCTPSSRPPSPRSSSGCVTPSGRWPTAGATCGGLDSNEALPAHLRRKHFLDTTPGIVAASGHPLPGATVRPGDLAGWPWIDFDGPADADAVLPSLAAVLVVRVSSSGARPRTWSRSACSNRRCATPRSCATPDRIAGRRRTRPRQAAPPNAAAPRPEFELPGTPELPTSRKCCGRFARGMVGPVMDRAIARRKAWSRQAAGSAEAGSVGLGQFSIRRMPLHRVAVDGGLDIGAGCQIHAARLPIWIWPLIGSRAAPRLLRSALRDPHVPACPQGSEAACRIEADPRGRTAGLKGRDRCDRHSRGRSPRQVGLAPVRRLSPSARRGRFHRAAATSHARLGGT